MFTGPTVAGMVTPKPATRIKLVKSRKPKRSHEETTRRSSGLAKAFKATKHVSARGTDAKADIKVPTSEPRAEPGKHDLHLAPDVSYQLPSLRGFVQSVHIPDKVSSAYYCAAASPPPPEQEDHQENHQEDHHYDHSSSETVSPQTKPRSIGHLID